MAGWVMAIRVITIPMADMESTIPASLRKAAVLATILALSAIVITLSFPRFQAAFRFLPVDIAIRDFQRQGQVASNRLKVLIEFSEQALAMHDHYRFHNGLSLLHYLRAVDPLTPALERRPAYRLAESASMAALERAPAQPAAWLQLATIRWILYDEPETIIEPWKMSIFTGRMHSSLFPARVQIGLAHFELLDREGRAMLRDQLQLAWKLRPQQLLPVLLQYDRDLAKSGQLLINNDPVTLQELGEFLEKHRR